MCVLATVLDAVDLGFRTIVVEDALCSSFDEGHDALMTLYRNRFSEQIELMSRPKYPSFGMTSENDRSRARYNQTAKL